MQLANALVPLIGVAATQNVAHLPIVNALVVLIGIPLLQHAVQPQLDNVQHVPLSGMPPKLDAAQIHQASADVQHIGTLLNLNVAQIKQDNALVIHIGILLHLNAALTQMGNVPAIPVGTL